MPCRIIGDSMSIFSEANQHPQSLENEAGGTPLPAAEDFDTLYTDWIGKLENHLADLGHRSDLNLDDADIRFSSSLPLSRIRSVSVAIVGVGGLGNW